jgi:uroporphyrinogen-III decarboxylase
MQLLDYLPIFVTGSLSFSSDWQYYNAGAHFDEGTMLDPLKRLEMETIAGKRMKELYPAILGSPEQYKPSPHIGIGVATIPKILGCKVHFEPHMYPHATALLKEDDDPMNYKNCNIMDGMQWLFEEIDTFVEAGYGRNNIGLPDLQGPLNLSMKIVGDNRMLGLIARPNRAATVDHILNEISDAYIYINQQLRKATGRPEKQPFSVSGCTYYYISPKQWTRFILPIVKKCEILGDDIRMHHCGEANRDRIEAYSAYPWTSVELGFGSDLKFARQKFIHPKRGPVPFSCRVSPYRMLNQSADQIEKDINWILDTAKGGPVSISCVGVPYQTPEANIWAFWNTIEAYNKKKAEEEEDEE